MTDAHYQQALALFDQGRHAEGVKVLVVAAQAGHVPSMSLLGGQLLTGRGVPADTPTGIRLILAAAERGGGFACATAANLFAWGFYSGQPEWPRALDYLQRAAELGYAPAQAQLRLLSGYKHGIDWKKLRRAIDINALRKFPKPQVLSEDPSIHAVPGLLSAEICDALIAQARPRLSPAMIYNELKGGNTLSQGRNHTAAQFQITDMDMVMVAVTERLCALAGLPLFHAETLQVLHYEVGECFKPHFDFWDPDFEGHVATMATYGQRVFTVLVYLNDDFEGGETDFPRLGVRYRGGKRGDGLIFRNVDAEGKPDRQTLHAGLPPTRGEKWLLSLWIRDKIPDGYGDPRVRAALEGR
jgi:prolyl 4-hydroxylase